MVTAEAIDFPTQQRIASFVLSNPGGITFKQFCNADTNSFGQPGSALRRRCQYFHRTSCVKLKDPSESAKYANKFCRSSHAAIDKAIPR